jgi:D-alanine-D-alanine ligase
MGLHGANGEDGRIQATLDLYGIPYTGTDYISSAICMDKGITKKFFNMASIPNAKGYDMNLDEEFKEIGYPIVVKVSTGGSSVGTYICKDRAEVDHALNEAKKFDDKVVVEEFIRGREFTCGVVDGKALPIVEIAPKVGFYDFANKYQAGQTNDICPAVLPEDKTLEIQRTAEEAYKVLKIKNYARIDFMMNEKGDIFCLEANTLPGMTPTSLLPMEAAAVGIDYPSLCEKLIEISLRNK